jgi:hypothetical protein
MAIMCAREGYKFFLQKNAKAVIGIRYMQASEKKL